MNQGTQNGKRGRIALLAAVNVGLVGVLAWQSVGEAVGQPAGAEGERRGPGRYTVVSGQFLGGLADAVYVIDSENRELAAIRYDPAARTVRVAGYRDLSRDAQQRPGR